MPNEGDASPHEAAARQVIYPTSFAADEEASAGGRGQDMNVYQDIRM
jgi:hypothetical protein